MVQLRPNAFPGSVPSANSGRQSARGGPSEKSMHTVVFPKRPSRRVLIMVHVATSGLDGGDAGGGGGRAGWTEVGG